MTAAIITQPPTVTLVTALAEASDLADAEYRAIYQQVAVGRSLRQIETALRSAVSYGWWGKYAAGERPLDRERKNELRAWAGLPALPPTIVDAITTATHPDAAVYRIGDGIANRVVLLGADVTGVTVSTDGAPQIAGRECGPQRDARPERVYRRWRDMPIAALRAALEARQPYQP